MSKKIYIQQAELKHFGILGMKWGLRKAKTSGSQNNQRGLKPRPSEVRASISAKTKQLVETGKKKFSELPQRKQDGLKVLALLAGTSLATVALAKGSQTIFNKWSKMSYDASINDIAMTIVKAYKTAKTPVGMNPQDYANWLEKG